MAGTALAVVQTDRVEIENRRASLEDAARVIISGLDAKMRHCVMQRRPVEDRWMCNLRAYHGVYEPKLQKRLTDAKQSTAYIHLTRHKTNGWSARISDLLFPTDNKNWGINPTPIPTLTGKAKEAAAAAIAKIKEANAAADQADAQQDPAAAQIAQQLAQDASEFAEQVKQHYAAIEEAKRRCEWMERTIEDQLIESDYITECRDVIEDGCKLGTGILKGPTTVTNLGRKWSEMPVVINGQPVADPQTGGPKTKWAMERQHDPRPMYKRVNPWFFYPDMSASSMKEAEFSFEMSLPSRKDLKRSAMKLGFNREAVKQLLDEGPPYTPDSILTHIAELRSLTDENQDIRDRYVMWEYNGPLECDDICRILAAMGRDEEAKSFQERADPFEEYRVIVHFIGAEVLRIVPDYPLDSGDGLYSVWNFEKSEASIFGYGVPELMKDSQDSLNEAWRQMHDNGALAVGPQIVIEKGAVEPRPGEGHSMTPLKIWERAANAYATAQSKPFEVFDIPNNQQFYAGMIELAKAFADEESAMPDLAQGEQGASSQTLGGMSILFNSANVVFRRVVKSWDDDLTKPTLRRAYDWNMQFNKDDSIKGDMQVDARGTSVLLVREIQSQNLMAIISNFPNNPALAPFIKIRETLVKTFQTMMIPPDDVLYTQEEVEKKAAEAAQQPPPPDPAVQIAQMRIESEQKIAEMREQGAAAARDMQMQMAQAKYEAEMTKLEQTSGLTRAQLEAKSEVEHRKIDSSERMKAAEISVEHQREQQGIDPGKGIG